MSLAGFILSLAAACSSPTKRNYTRTTESDETPSMEHKRIETKNLGRGETKVDATVQEPAPLEGAVELKTWSDEVIRGRMVSERPDEYVLDVGPEDGSKPSIRRVPRSAIMEVKHRHRAP